MLDAAIKSLLDYAEKWGLIETGERAWACNVILDALQLDELTSSPCDKAADGDQALHEIIDVLLDDAVARGVIPDSVTHRDLLYSRILGVITPRPGQITHSFWERYAEDPTTATDWFYAFSQNTGYIRTERTALDMNWVTQTAYGEIDVTINLAKPEKDPIAIAAALEAKTVGYPACPLCRENEGYAGRINHPGRLNHRIVPLTLAGESWFFQYSPYVYYNEHSIALNAEHVPMRIDRACFEKLIDFVTQFPHYFMGSNADLPIVGGSILTHDHFQGGCYVFPMERAEIETPLQFPAYPSVSGGIVRWPMSVIRLTSADTEQLIEAADHILTSWRDYSDPSAYIFAETEGVRHNTITPIARRRGTHFELDLVLRNNITTEEFPMGLYHPHPEHHHIKRENIGLIEVMGLAVLPARLKAELSALAQGLATGAALRDNPLTAHHADWAETFRDRHDFSQIDPMEAVKQETGQVFVSILEQAGVYARTKEGQAAFLRFVETMQ